MQNTTQPIDRASLLIEANKLIRDHEDTLAGIEATGVEQRNGVLVFSGEYFLDEQGLPTPKSTAVFNMFKYGTYAFREISPGRLTQNARHKPRVFVYSSGFCPRCSQRSSRRSALSAALLVKRSRSRLR